MAQRQAVRGTSAPSETPDDPLSCLAQLLQVRPFLDELCDFGGHWASPHPADRHGWAYFHMLTCGECELEVVGQTPLRLEAGDVVLLPHGDPHVLRALPGATGAQAGVVAKAYRNSIRRKITLDAEPDTQVICGRLQFESATESLVIAALPQLILLRGPEWPDALETRPLLERIRDELDADRPGAAAITTNLASALLVMMLRAYLAASSASGGLLRLLGSRPTARAVLAMLREPARPWTLTDLAARAATSRATLVRAFRAAVNCPPLAFLTDLRLSLARRQLLRGSSLGQVATEVGYQSESALSRAMHRRHGVRPGEIRRAGEAASAERRIRDDARLS
ncbi:MULTISPECIES: AraC family transcriptional regulator [Inquilinus]|uniref:AraC family transcriptional activator of mtrCDE n=1 Tax=Inquilinus ginsengisoli TaxID=363840 RepID=A0ABU1JS77_9PROT|nr:AraC family transcriptional regulator [Inquilinus ginsengisoli]MDR6291471.1 AraC family transcriptional activator of mtrCDE [Inquilinus ginsengisoli]